MHVTQDGSSGATSLPCATPQVVDYFILFILKGKQVAEIKIYIGIICAATMNLRIHGTYTAVEKTCDQYVPHEIDLYVMSRARVLRNASVEKRKRIKRWHVSLRLVHVHVRRVPWELTEPQNVPRRVAVCGSVACPAPRAGVAMRGAQRRRQRARGN